MLSQGFANRGAIPPYTLRRSRNVVFEYELVCILRARQRTQYTHQLVLPPVGRRRQPTGGDIAPTVAQTFGDTGCHPERSEGSVRPISEILSAAKDDSQDCSLCSLTRKSYLQMPDSRQSHLPFLQYALRFFCWGRGAKRRDPNKKIWRGAQRRAVTPRKSACQTTFAKPCAQLILLAHCIVLW